ncbi:MAG TPA: glycosyltransferase family 2 protein [Bryobacteraceae bacterium]|nr:glycosyltransferase family 2 protein [Bryobacteraceae bacterium]
MPAIVIVTYNSGEVIGPCLDSCLRQPGFDVVVVDNNSRDNTVPEVRLRPEVRLIVNSENRGFAGGVNQGVDSTAAAEVLLLNPDVVLESSLEPLVGALRDPSIGASTGMLLNLDGSSQHAFHLRNLPAATTLVFEVLGVNRLWPGNPVNRRYRFLAAPVESQAVEQPAAAFLMLRRSVWAAIGGFDEGFHPLWVEDVDFCKRLQQAGYRITFVPGVVARHKGGHSATGMCWESRHIRWYGSLLRYASKYFEGAGWTCVVVSVLVGSLARVLARVGVQLSFRPLSAYISVVRLASLYLQKGNRRRASEAACPVNKGEQAAFRG